tara:strand:+ start:18047 stop:18223 length:177 start_codon:yes stop_codon:yes gene_type:complete
MGRIQHFLIFTLASSGSSDYFPDFGLTGQLIRPSADRTHAAFFGPPRPDIQGINPGVI